ncbi:uncharacterized protein PV06_08395 [Exophiala oligosperma]|uniref:Uncharacterized protein n=1 Tax=Exophiala oligosperma TaxID=215243 RepID=A0A0D2AI25_9EURO|nr:uncharacterized protein PV06_08395 [Exophiala oligosperma]KIW39811.1 hypothetical protein PV06_08395 [Exophiala oligosperma]
MPPQPGDQTNETEEECKWEEPTREVEEEDDNMLIHLEWGRLRREFQSISKMRDLPSKSSSLDT